MTLLSTADLKERLEKYASNAKEVTIVSAFVTDSAINWLKDHLPTNSRVVLMCRARPFDFLNGASTLSALKQALDLNWNLSINQELHAKIYLFDRSHCFVGSSNLTANGLVLAASGNIEANTYFGADHSSLLFVDSLLRNSRVLDHDDLLKMESYLHEKIQSQKTQSDINQYWPDDIIQEPFDDIFTVDFPLSPYGKNRGEINRFNEIDNLVRQENFEQATLLFKSTRIYNWIKMKIESHGVLYFGNLSKIIHAEISDDPSPYRKSIKNLQTNLYEYIEYLADDVEIIRPRYSQALVLSAKQTNTSKTKGYITS